MKTHELYSYVTQQVIEQLNQGVVPWVRPWKDEVRKGVGMMPSNLVSGRLYSGSNILLLWMHAAGVGYPHLQFCTYQQVNSIGATVRKGEKAAHIIFTKHVRRKDEDSGEEKSGTIVKSYPVFNVAQLDKVPEKYLVQQTMFKADQPTNERAMQFVRGTGIRVDHGANKAAYYPARDEIVMPTVGAFVNEDAYFGTLNHELTHASGHKDRLNRVFGKRLGDRAYAAEEIVAELGSAFLWARLGIEPSFRSASYIDSWLKVLSEDNRAIFTAASYAGQAADWLWTKAYPEEEQLPQAAE